MDEPSPKPAVRAVGLVVHPSRPLDGVLEQIHTWARERGLTVGQIPVPGQARQVAEPVEAEACDLLLALGGDGTALTALHAGARSSRPALGVACGSIGALTAVSADRVTWALEQIAGGDWTPVAVPGLDVVWGDAHTGVAINDLAVIREGPGQITVSITVDGVLYAQVAGDGIVVGTALGSSAYTMAAGGPILAPGAEGMAVTSLAAHGGSCPPLVAGTDSRLDLGVDPGRAAFRCELDGHRTPVAEGQLRVRHRPGYATLAKLAGEEPRLAGLRRRGLVVDSPRVLVRSARSGG
jgi:NAD+ kinase